MAITPSGNIGTLSPSASYWFAPFLAQTFSGTVSGGYAAPTTSGNGYGGVNNTGFIFQNGQYNTNVRGF